MTATLPAIWLGVTPTICEGEETTTEEAATAPKVTLAPDWKFDPLIVTEVPPVVGPEAGEMLLIVGEAAGAILALNPADARRACLSLLEGKLW